MFEKTLEAQALDLSERNLGTISAAMLAHAGALGVVVVVAALTMPPPPEGPPLRPDVVIFIPPIDLLTQESPKPSPPPSPHRDGGRSSPSAPVTPVPEPIAEPTATPDILPEPASTPGDDTNVGVPGEPGDGRGPGIPGSTGNGGGGPDDGTGLGGPVVLTGEMIAPRLVTRVDPLYPNVARKARLQGRVIVEAVIGLDGGVESAKILTSTNTLFDDAALEAVRQWRYTPATMSGRPVRVYFTVSVAFVIR